MLPPRGPFAPADPFQRRTSVLDLSPPPERAADANPVAAPPSSSSRADAGQFATAPGSSFAVEDWMPSSEFSTGLLPAQSLPFRDGHEAAMLEKRRRHFPSVPWYVPLHGLRLEVPLALSTASCTGIINDPNQAAKIGLLSRLLSGWSAGAHVPVDDADADANEDLNRQRSSSSSCEGRTSFELSGTRDRGELGAATTTTTGVSRGASSSFRTERSLSYQTFLEGLSDATRRFFSGQSNRSQITTTTSAAAAGAVPAEDRTVRLLVEQHPQWRDLHVQWIWEEGRPHIFLSSSSRVTQNKLSEASLEVGVELSWFRGAALVSSSDARTPVTWTTDPTLLALASKVDPVMAVTDIVLNLPLLWRTTSNAAVVGGGSASGGGTASSSVAAAWALQCESAMRLGSRRLPCDVTLQAPFAFLHSTARPIQWKQQATLCLPRRGPPPPPQRNLGDSTLASNSSSDSSAGGSALFVWTTSTLAPATGGEDAQRGASILPCAVHRLLSLLIDEVGLHHFTIRCVPPAHESTLLLRSAAAAAAAGTTMNGGGGAVELSGRSPTSRRGVAGGGGGGGETYSSSLSSSSTVPTVMRNALAISRLSASAWLRGVSRVEAGGRLVDEVEECDGEADAVEAEFYPISIAFHREALADGSALPRSPCSPASLLRHQLKRGSSAGFATREPEEEGDDDPHRVKRKRFREHDDEGQDNRRGRGMGRRSFVKAPITAFATRTATSFEELRRLWGKSFVVDCAVTQTFLEDEDED